MEIQQLHFIVSKLEWRYIFDFILCLQQAFSRHVPENDATPAPTPKISEKQQVSPKTEKQVSPTATPKQPEKPTPKISEKIPTATPKVPEKPPTPPPKVPGKPQPPPLLPKTLDQQNLRSLPTLTEKNLNGKPSTVQQPRYCFSPFFLKKQINCYLTSISLAFSFKLDHWVNENFFFCFLKN